MTDLIPMGEAMARIGELEADNVRLTGIVTVLNSAAAADQELVDMQQDEIDRLNEGRWVPAEIARLNAEIERLNSLHLPNYWDAKRAVEIFKTEYVGQDQLTLWKSIVAEVKSNE